MNLEEKQIELFTFPFTDALGIYMNKEPLKTIEDEFFVRCSGITDSMKVSEEIKDIVLDLAVKDEIFTGFL